jgi:hypothetical protein
MASTCLFRHSESKRFHSPQKIVGESGGENYISRRDSDALLRQYFPGGIGSDTGKLLKCMQNRIINLSRQFNRAFRTIKCLNEEKLRHLVFSVKTIKTSAVGYMSSKNAGSI